MEQPSEFKDLQTLLRLKKYEQPPQGYEQRFLHEFHRRQRWEAGRRSSFAVLQERFSDWLGSLTVPKYAYAGTFGLFLAVAAMVTEIGGNPAVPSKITVIKNPPPVLPPTLVLNRPLDLSDLDVQTQIVAGQRLSQSDSHPRYILDARPASYEAPFSF